MRKYILLLFLFLNSVNSFSQNQNSIWCFGDSAGIDFSNTSIPTITSSISSRGSCASIADSIGDLLFYANTKASTPGNTGTIWNKNHQLMQDGDSIVGEGWYNELLIVPYPDNLNMYYLFSTGLTGSSQIGLYYSVIDMQQNAGLGKVIQKNVQLLSSKTADCIKAIENGNGRDWWLITKLSNAPITQLNRFYVFKISVNGVSAPVIQDLGNSSDGTLQRFTFNAAGNKLILFNTAGFMSEYEFDRCTGLISNPNIIFPEQTSGYSRLFWEGAYSPNDSLFYVSTIWYNSTISDTSRLLQYNLFAPDIPSSCDTLFQTARPLLAGAVRLAPDNKIYFSCAYEWGFPLYPYPDSVRNIYNENLSVINAPDNYGAACDFQPFSFYLGGKRTYWGLPNNPNYELGRWVGSPCDTITSFIEESPILNDAEFYVFYHSGWQQLFINAKNIKGSNSLLQIFDLSGKEVFSSAKKTQPPYFTQDVNCSSFANGLYIVSLTTEKERLIGKFVKE